MTFLNSVFLHSNITVDYVFEKVVILKLSIKTFNKMCQLN